MKTLYLLLSVLIGFVLSFQPGANIRIAKQLPSPVHGALVNFLIGALALLVLVLARTGSAPAPRKLADTPWWGWSGGFIGAAFVLGAIYLTPPLGATLFVAGSILGNMLGSLLVDHYGLVGLEPNPLTLGKAAGATLVVAGVAMIRLL